MTDLQIRRGYANGTLTDCDVCGATIKNGEECAACGDVTDPIYAHVAAVAEAAREGRSYSSTNDGKTRN